VGWTVNALPGKKNSARFEVVHRTKRRTKAWTIEAVSGDAGGVILWDDNFIPPDPIKPKIKWSSAIKALWDLQSRTGAAGRKPSKRKRR
jgi:hypothetical protein